MGESRIKFGQSRSKGFFILFRDVAQDVRLSLEARGLFAMMASLPEDWEYSVSGLALKAGCGKDKTRRLLKELEKVGYLIREQSHDNGGKFAGNVYVLQDEAPPLSGNTDNGENRQREKPSSGFPTQKNIDSKEEETKKPPNPQRGNGGAKASKYDLQEDAKPVLRRYCGDDMELAQALADLIAVRRELKAINSKRGITALLSELDRLSGGHRETKLLLLRQSVANSWKSVFPLKGSGQALTVSEKVQEEEGAYAL